jgi:guanidinopropionase
VNDFYGMVSPVTNEAYQSLEDLRFMGGTSLMRAPLATTLEGLDIALVGVPTDHGVTFQPGARHGPREIRNKSNVVRRVNVVTRVDPFSLCRIADVGDVRFDTIYHLDEVVAQIEALFTRLHAAGPVPLSAGGDHSITYPIMKALGAQRPLGMVHIDAHLDTWDAIGGSKYHHGAPFRRAVEAGVLDPKRCIQIGIRGYQNFMDGFEYSIGNGMRVVQIDEFQGLGVQAVVAEARRVVGDGPTYVTLDVDGLDPVYTPGTGTPEIGGLTTRETLALLQGLRGLNLVGGDVVEVAPPLDQSGGTALVGASLMYEILCLLAESIASRR